MNIEQEIQTELQMEFNHRTVVNLMKTVRLIEDEIIHVLRPFKLTMQQYNVLRILRGQGVEPANSFTVTERIIHRNSSTTRLIDKLIIKGLCERTICKNNRRKVEIFITSKGLLILKKLDPLFLAKNEEIFKNLSLDRQEDLNNILESIKSFKEEN